MQTDEGTTLVAQSPVAAARTPNDVSAVRNRAGAMLLDTFIDSVSPDDALEAILDWARSHQSRSIYFCNVHSLVTARHDLALRTALATGDLLAPDGFPIARLLREAGFKGQGRISGPDLMPRILGAAARDGLSVYFYGEEPYTLGCLRSALAREFPSLTIAGMYSPPFRPLSVEEDCKIVNAINESRAHILLVALGCPKQEKWIAAHKGHIRATMLGLGAAFAFFSGVKSRGPRWMQEFGLEWLYRLLLEPRRLARRYFVTNSAFIFYALRDLLSGRLRASTAEVTMPRQLSAESDHLR